MMKRKEARFCAAHSQFPRSLILIYLVSDTFQMGKGERGKGEGGDKYLLHLKMGERGESYAYFTSFNSLE